MNPTAALIIGGGAFGLHLAKRLAARLGSVVVCEREPDFLRRASYANQARVHNGYHYPRSTLTAWRSHLNYGQFLAEYGDCVYDRFTKLYAVGRRLSNVSAGQFAAFAARIQAPLRAASPAVRRLFDDDLIENVYVVDECAFDANVLRSQLVDEARGAGVELLVETRVERVRSAGSGLLEVDLASGERRSTRTCLRVFNCTYSGLNDVLEASELPLVPLKYEFAELCLVDVPSTLRELGVTVMCGPFFSCMPYPAEACHSLSHVRYTPHFQWYDSALPRRRVDEVYRGARRQTMFPAMVRDATRFMPQMRGTRYRRSLWEIKALLPKCEIDDGRPILFRTHHGLQNHHLVLGGKIDNVYDVTTAIDRLLDAET
jgi:glycine/D-amino acid oxidase-like deaminating enzyme